MDSASSVLINSLGEHGSQVYIQIVEKTAKKFRSFAESEKADRDFYKKLTGAVGRPQNLADLDTLEN